MKTAPRHQIGALFRVQKGSNRRFGNRHVRQFIEGHFGNIWLQTHFADAFKRVHPRFQKSKGMALNDLALKLQDSNAGVLRPFLFWIFPLIAPLFEAIFRLHQRAPHTNKTGAFA